MLLLFIWILGSFKIASALNLLEGNCFSTDNATCVAFVSEENSQNPNIGVLSTYYSKCSTECKQCENSAVIFSNITFPKYQFINLTLGLASDLHRAQCEPCDCDRKDYYLSFKTIDVTGKSHYDLIVIPTPLEKSEENDPNDSGSSTYNENKWNSKKPWSLDKSQDLSHKKRLEGVNITFSNPILRVLTLNPASTWIIVSIRSETFLLRCSQNPCINEIEDKFLITDSSMEVHIFIDEVLELSQTFTIIKQDTCTIVECTFICKEYFTHFICYSTMTQIFIGVSFAVSCLILISLLITIVVCVYRSQIVKSLYYKILFRNIKYTSSDDSEEVDLSNLDSQSDDIDNPYDLKSKRAKGFKIHPVHMCLLCILILAPSVNSECIGTTILSSSITECLRLPNGINRTDCSLNLNTQILLPTIGASACLTFYDERSKILVGSLEVKLNSVKVELYLRHLYYTARWNLETASAKYCPATTEFCDSGCHTTDPDNIDMLSGLVTHLPGFTECRSSCGCAGCGCLVCDDACLYSRYAIKPWGSAARVADFLEAKTFAEISVNWHPSASKFEIDGEEIFTASQHISNLFGFQFVSSGPLSSPVLTFLDKAVVSDSEHAYISDYSPIGQPRWNVIGDIQAAYHNWLDGDGSDYSFSFPEQVLHSTAVPNGVVYTDPGDSLLSLASDPNSLKLPLEMNGLVWSFTPDKLIGLWFDPPPVLLYVSTNQPVIMEVEVSHVCPKIESIRVTGCYNCPLGASLVILARSECDTGSVISSLVSENSLTLLRGSIFLTNENTEIILPLLSSSKNIQGTLSLIYLDSVAEIQFSGVLSEPPKIIGGDSSQNNSTAPTKDLSEQTFSEWWDSLVGPLMIAKYFIAIILAVVGLAILLSISTLLIKMILNCRRAYDLSNYKQV